MLLIKNSLGRCVFVFREMCFASFGASFDAESLHFISLPLLFTDFEFLD